LKEQLRLTHVITNNKKLRDKYESRYLVFKHGHGLSCI